MTGERPALAYQSFGRMRGMERYQDSLERLIRSVPVDADVRVLRLPDTEISGKGFASAQALDLPAILRSMAEAATSGADAIAVGNGFDPGLWEARELLDVPVVGLFEAVAFYALRVGWRLGVVTSGASGVPRIEQLGTQYGIRARMVRPASASVTVPMVVSAFDRPEVARRVLTATEAAIRTLAERGADVVMVASGALDVFLSEAGRPEGGVPVLPSVTTLVHHLYGAALLARDGVPYVSRAGRFASPPPEILAGLAGQQAGATAPARG
jgi:Asp/Glu/hydantoin racemase